MKTRFANRAERLFPIWNRFPKWELLLRILRRVVMAFDLRTLGVRGYSTQQRGLQADLSCMWELERSPQLAFAMPKLVCRLSSG